MLDVLGLTKVYGKRAAVCDLSFAVKRGEVVGFLGPNGAGKTTTLRMIAGFLGPSAGDVLIGGFSVHSEPVQARRLLGYMPEDCPYYPELRVREYLAFRARLKGVQSGRVKHAVERSAVLTRIDDRLESLVGHLSKGYRQRLGLADALIAEPPLLVLDEPTSGLDPNQIRDVRTVLKDLAQEHTVLLSTHILTEVEQTCERALVIHRGNLVAQDTIAALKSAQKVAEAELEVALPSHGVADTLLSAVQRRELLDTDAAHDAPRFERWIVSLEQPQLTSVEAWVSALSQAGVLIRRADQRRASLEEVFAHLTREEGA